MPLAQPPVVAWTPHLEQSCIKEVRVTMDGLTIAWLTGQPSTRTVRVDDLPATSLLEPSSEVAGFPNTNSPRTPFPEQGRALATRRNL
jgi:hypothetical protein